MGFEELKKITHIQIAELQNRLIQQNVQLKVTPKVLQFISDKSFDPSQGARFIRKNIQTFIEDPLAEKIISGAAREGSIVSVDVKKDKLGFTIEKTEKIAVPA